MKSIIIALVLAVFALNGQALAYTEQRELKLDAGGIRTLDISCGAGELLVEGQERPDIQVSAEIEIDGISDEKAVAFIEKQVQLWLRKDGDLALLKSEIEDGFRNGAEARIHLRVAVPREMNLRVADGSGSMEVRHLNARLDIRDGSGSIQVHSIRGDIRIKDGSGSIQVRDAAGGQTIDDGSGEIFLERVQGDVTIRDGSGDIAAREVLGNLDITDGSGSIRVGRVGGSVRIIDGSGSMDIRDVEGDVTIESDTSGSRTISGVKGTVVARD